MPRWWNGRARATLTVFMELRDQRPANGGGHVVFSAGSPARAFTVFVPDANVGADADVMNRALTRHVSGGVAAPRRLVPM